MSKTDIQSKQIKLEVMSTLIHSQKINMLARALKDQDSIEYYSIKDCEKIIYPYEK